jgi:serine protease
LLALALVAWVYYAPPASVDHLTDAQLAADASTDPDDILVDLRDDASDALVADLERDLGIDLTLVSRESRDEQFYRAHVDPARQAAILAALAQRAEVEIAEPDAEMSIPAGEQAAAAPVGATHEGYPDDPKYRYQWHLRQIGMPEAWKLADGNGTVVAVLDTGVAYEQFGKYHQVEDLVGVEFVSPFDFVDNDQHANDDHGHGTHVTGSIAQVTNNGKGVAGVARNVRIMPLKVLGGDGRGSVGGIADAIRYAADKGAKVINMSLGGPFSSRVMKKAVAYAIAKGTTVIAAAGNDGRGKVGYPAGYDDVVAVAATQFDETTTFYSNYGKDVDIAAPGGNTRVDQNNDGVPDGVLQNTIVVGDPTKSDYFPFMGTSMASPHVAGVAALVVGEGVTKPADVAKVLYESSRKPAAQKYDRDRYGAGIVDAPAAIRLARGEATSSATAASPSRTVAQVVLALLVAGAVAASTRKRGITLGLGYLGGAVLAVGGLALLGALGLAVDGNPLIQSAMIPLVLLGMGYGSKPLRGPLAGVAAGAAAHLMFLAVTGAPVRWVPFDAAWLAVNALACLGLARAALRR